MCLSQREMINKLLKEIQMDKLKSVPTTMIAHAEPRRKHNLVLSPNDAERYRSIVRSHLHIGVKIHPDPCVAPSSLG